MLTRRTFLGASALLAVANETVSEAVARPASGDAGLTWAELPLARGRGEAYRALVLRPARAAPDRTYPGLLLFHGRGESRSPELGLHAWRTAYGLERAHARLARPPLSLAASERRCRSRRASAATSSPSGSRRSTPRCATSRSRG